MRNHQPGQFTKLLQYWKEGDGEALGALVTIDDADPAPVAGDAQLLALDAALDDLARMDEREAKIVKIRFVGGLLNRVAAQ